jgi:hypothetical protein
LDSRLEELVDDAAHPAAGDVVEVDRHPDAPGMSGTDLRDVEAKDGV